MSTHCPLIILQCSFGVVSSDIRSSVKSDCCVEIFRSAGRRNCSRGFCVVLRPRFDVVRFGCGRVGFVVRCVVGDGDVSLDRDRCLAPVICRCRRRCES